jgi:Flp pilus assembly protein TadG
MNMKTYVVGGTTERGAVLIQVAIAILVLTALTAFVVDYGVLWVARSQAQNAADAGALAGAVALRYDETAYPPTSTGMAFQSAQRAALCASGSANCPATPLSANPVWPTQAGSSSAVNVSWTCPSGLTGNCVRVDVYRDGTNGSTALPTFFGPLLGMASQKVRATASARWAYANAADCLRPFSVADRWNENMSPVDYFNRYDSSGNLLAGTPDQYVPPTSTSAGSGYRLPADYGVQQTLMLGNPSNNDPIQKGWSLPLRLPDPDGGYFSGASEYKDSIVNCKASTVAIGDYLALESGAMTGPTSTGFDELKAKDPNAIFDNSTNPPTIRNSCTSANPPCAGQSPRIIPIAVWDMDEFQWRSNGNRWGTQVYTDANGGTHSLPGGACPGTGNKCVRVVNILGFFADHTTNGNPKTVVGYLTTTAGVVKNGAPTVGGGAAFLSTIQLVR